MSEVTKHEGFANDYFIGMPNASFILTNMLHSASLRHCYELEKEGKSVYCIKRKLENKENEFIYHITYETEEGICECGKCEENIIEFVGGRHGVLHKDAGQIIYKGDNIPALKKHAEEMKGKKITFKMNNMYAIAQ